MKESVFLLVNVVVFAITTAAPVANEQNVAPAASNAEDMIMVGKRAEEMMFYGNQQNEARFPMKKSQPLVTKPIDSIGEVDQGAKMVAHEEIPVEEDLNDRAEAVRGESDLDRLAEGLKVAEEHVEEAAGENEEEPIVKDKKEDENVMSDEGVDNTEGNTVAVDLPQSVEGSEDFSDNEAGPVMDIEQNSPDSSDENENGDDDDADEELASLSNEMSSPSEEEENSDDSDDDSSSNDVDVEEFLDELRKESEDNEKNEMEGEETGNTLKSYKEAATPNSVVDPNYYNTLYHIMANTYRGADDYYNYNMMVPSYYIRRRRRSSLRRRRNNQVRRIKRDLPSDWLAAYRGLDIPYSNDLQDSLLGEPQDSYEDEEPISEELSRYINANLLNKLFGDSLQVQVEEEIPYDEILPYEVGPEIPESILEEYEPEEILYEPEMPKVYRENPYEDYVPEYRKRSGADYFPDSRRKRYFYPFYDEPETHWGAFVPEKRSNYDEALQRLQRLAIALNDDPRPYYESLLREYKKK